MTTIANETLDSLLDRNGKRVEFDKWFHVSARLWTGGDKSRIYINEHKAGTREVCLGWIDVKNRQLHSNVAESVTLSAIEAIIHA